MVGLNVFFHAVLKGLCPLEAYFMSELVKGRLKTENWMDRQTEIQFCMQVINYSHCYFICFHDILKKTVENRNIICFSNSIFLHSIPYFGSGY